MSAFGGLLGLFAAIGMLTVVIRLPRFRRLSLVDKVSPYLLDSTRPSSLLVPQSGKRSGGTLRRLLEPSFADLARRVDQAVGRNASIRRRLGALGSLASVEEFRQEQLLWAVAGSAGGSLLLAVRVMTGVGPPVLSFVGLVVLGGFAGFIGRDVQLTRAVRRREERMARELPAVAELLALAVGAGESPVAALERVTRRSGGELGRELAAAVADARAGRPFAQALTAMAERCSLPALSRFVDGMTVALSRGTPMAEVLRAQALDVREEGRRNLLQTGGKREIAMMVPVVFLVLPVTILFALYPGAVTLTSISQ